MVYMISRDEGLKNVFFTHPLSWRKGINSSGEQKKDEN